MLSNMPGYRVKKTKEVKPKITHQNKETTLTIIGDSYTQHFDSDCFSSGDYHFIHWDAIPDTVASLDSTKKNILIVESTERYIRWRFTKNHLMTVGTKAPVSISKESPPTNLLAEKNLQYLLNNFDWQLPFKELKTLINLHVFNKFSLMVARPDASGRLYLSETVEPNHHSSSFVNVPDTEIKDMVTNLNTISKELKQIGFDDVYISIIPNAASIYKTNYLPYNHLIERIQNDSAVHFKFIELYKPFIQQQHSVFLCNDSHWNELGKMIWLLQVNAIIDKASTPH